MTTTAHQRDVHFRLSLHSEPHSESRSAFAKRSCLRMGIWEMKNVENCEDMDRSIVRRLRAAHKFWAARQTLNRFSL